MAYFIIAASSLYNATFDGPHLFDSQQQNFFAMPGLSLNNKNLQKNIVHLLEKGLIKTNGRPIVLWHDAINNSLSSKKTKAMSITSFFNCLAYLSRNFNVRYFTYLPRIGATDVNKFFSLCPRNITYLKMWCILTPRYKKILASHSDLHLHYIVEASMFNRVIFHPNLRSLAEQRELNRQRNLRNRVRFNFIILHHCGMDNNENVIFVVVMK